MFRLWFAKPPIALSPTEQWQRAEEDKAQGLATKVDLKLFYPKPFKQVLLQPDAKA
jgi:hypothetical protein